MRELFYDRNPGDARVKVGSERQAASSPTSANVGADEIGYFSRAALSAGTLQNWRFHGEDYSHKYPYTTVGFGSSDAQMLSQVAYHAGDLMPRSSRK